MGAAVGSFRLRSNLSESEYIRQHILKSRQHGPSEELPLVERLRAIVGFENYSVSGLDIDGCRVGKGFYLSTDFPTTYLQEYTEQEYFRHDPLARLVAPETPVARWEDVPDDELTDKDALVVEAALRKYQIAPRTAFSLWSGTKFYGAVMFTRRKPFSDEETEILALFAEALHSKAAAPVIALANARLNLTSGELRCLSLAAEGKSSAEIADDSRYTTETVNFYLKSAIKKLGASNRTQAVVTAIRRGII